MKFCLWATAILPILCPHLQVIFLFPEPNFKGFKWLFYFALQCSAHTQWLMAVQLLLRACGRFHSSLKHTPHWLWTFQLRAKWTQRQTVGVNVDLCTLVLLAVVERHKGSLPWTTTLKAADFSLHIFGPISWDVVPEAVWLVQGEARDGNLEIIVDWKVLRKTPLSLLGGHSLMFLLFLLTTSPPSPSFFFIFIAIIFFVWRNSFIKVFLNHKNVYF